MSGKVHTFTHWFEGSLRMTVEVDLQDPRKVAVKTSLLALNLVWVFFEDEWAAWLKHITGSLKDELTEAQWDVMCDGTFQIIDDPPPKVEKQ